MTDPNQGYPPPQGQGPQPGYPSAPPPGYPSAPPPGYPSGPQPGYPSAPGYPAQYGAPGGLALPQGVELASVGRRIGAYFLAIPLFVVTLGIGYIVWGLILWGKSTSPALKVLGCKVVNADTGQVVTFGTMALRDILGRIVDGILSIITGLISFVMFVSGDKHQSLHDKVGGTTVVYDPNKVFG